jgi:hypothetical protein
MDRTMALMPKLKAHLIIEHSEDDQLLRGFLHAAINYAESYQHRKDGYYSDHPFPSATEQAIFMLTSHFYESRDGSTGGFYNDNVQASQQVWTTVNLLLKMNMDWGKAV